MQSIKIPDYRLIISLQSHDKHLLPWNYREHVQQWIYAKCLDGTIMGQRLHNARYTLYTYALLPVKPWFKGGGLYAEEGIWFLYVASALREFLHTIEVTVNSLPTLDIVPGITFEVIQVGRQPLVNKNLFASQPIFIEDCKSRAWRDPSQPEFSQGVVKALANRFEYLFDMDPGPISFRFVGTPRKKMIQYKGQDFLAFAGDIRLSGSTMVRNLAQCVGLGMKPSAGFGMLL